MHCPDTAHPDIFPRLPELCLPACADAYRHPEIRPRRFGLVITIRRMSSIARFAFLAVRKDETHIHALLFSISFTTYYSIPMSLARVGLGGLRAGGKGKGKARRPPKTKGKPKREKGKYRHLLSAMQFH